ncbi:type VII secretion protein EccC [Catellatospora sp. TT07R-123]|uniref:type VII secretion protein EccCa n=1 Tax=Catellatospora sp. TT07R-123 TaxID=2733863 RepID=UPI001B1E8C94|nr:type VII secretion protein EccCa [Catellatospora sp. TT07R-123]GHJ46940.1 type VII secretion protein EccC [Catellatospora sp. TT07R-123]
MTTVVFRRPARQPGPSLPRGELVLQEPPTLPEVGGADLSAAFTYLPAALGSGAMALIFIQPGGSSLSYLAGGMMGVSGLGMLVGQLGRGGGDRRRRLRGERRDYLRYLAQMRRQVRQVAVRQAKALAWTHPHPAALWSLAGQRRMWERRPTSADFGEIRLGLGSQRLTVTLTPPQTKPVEDLEPLCAQALRRFIEAHWSVPGLPVAVQLRGFARVLLAPSGTAEDGSGPDADDGVLGLVRAMLAQLATFHSPDDLRIVVCAPPERQERWDWVKWLPHAQHPGHGDGAGAARLLAENFADLERLLGPSFAERPRFDDPALPHRDEPYTVIVVDGAIIPPTARFAAGSVRNATVVDVSGALRWAADPLTLRLLAGPDGVEMVGADSRGRDTSTRLGVPDRLGPAGAAGLARRLSPYRLGASVETTDSLTVDLDLTTLLGLGDPETFDPDAVRAGRSRWDHLRVPIGVSSNGTPIELDLKEAAQGGMGPHGILIGATGSGKSELLRTLVLALGVTHSSDVLNFILVDFKGGATFLGLETLPHTSALITNLADELPLVDRMQETLQGELVRRQELLRQSGFSALKDYEKARTEGAPLDPLPTLLIVVDEFSELLATKRDFIDLFVMIGRLGRSLGVHLLLASQRLEEGRMHQLESHLSYRIGLRTFSAIESRSVIGVPDAYELPSAPGNGYLRADMSTLIRFKAAYVSAALRRAERRARREEARLGLVPYGLGHVPLPEQPDAAPEPAPADAEAVGSARLLDVIAARLVGHGPQAHQVWLPPLAQPPTLDQLLPPVLPHPRFGLSTRQGGTGTLRVPVGVIDRPLEQRRDLLMADLLGAGGHVGIGGGTQSGKSTLVRTLVTALALTHTPAEVQFYCLDFGGGSLAGLAGLPHVGTVVGRLDRERVSRTVAEVADLLARREQRFAAHGVDSIAAYRQGRAEGRLPEGADDGYGDVFLVVDGWLTLHQDFETLEPSFSELATRGLNYGVHLVVTASRWSEIRPWLRDLLGTRFELHLGDPVDSEVGMRQAANVPAVPGRGLTRDALHFLAALPRLDGLARTDDLAEAVRLTGARSADAWTGPAAPPVRLLPQLVAAADLPAPAAPRRVALGLDEQQLAPVWHDFDASPHLLVFGESESGKTNLLRLIAASIVANNPPGQARVLVADARRTLFDAVPPDSQVGYAVSGPALTDLVKQAMEAIRERLPGPDITPEQLSRRDWWVGPHLFVLVDDYDLLSGGHGSPLEPLLDALPQGADVGLHLVLARTTAGASRAMMMDPVLRRLWDLGGDALLFSYDKEEGSFLGEAKPRRLPRGRAQLVSRRRAALLVQTALSPRDRP